MSILTERGTPSAGDSDSLSIAAEFALAAATRADELAAVEAVIERIGTRYVTDLRELSQAFNCFYEAQLDVKEQQIAATASERDVAQRERDELVLSLRAAEMARAEREAQVAELTARLAVAEDRAGQLPERDQDLEGLRQALEAAGREQDESARIIADQRGELEQTLALAAAARRDLSAREGDLARAVEQLALVEHDRDELRGGFEAQGSELAEMASSAARLRDELADERGAAADLRERVATLQRERDDLAVRIAEFRANGDNHLRQVQVLCEELSRRAVVAERERDDLLAHLRGLLS